MRNKKWIAGCLLATCCLSLTAQDGIRRALKEIEHNSTTLRSMKKAATATMAGNRTGLALEAPEIGFNYLFGSNSSMPHRQDISVSQTFDFPTIGGAKRHAADGLDSLAARTFDADRAAYLLAAEKSCIELVYCNAAAAIFKRHRAILAEVVSLTEQAYARGNATAQELNDSQLALAELQLDEADNETERATLAAGLCQLNGGRLLVLTDTAYASRALPDDFDDWWDDTHDMWPALRVAEADVEAGHSAARLIRSENLPALSLGFMQETLPHEIYRGITFGLSIPLWSNRGKRRKAEADIAAAEARRDDARIQLRSTVEAAYRRALALERSAQQLRSSVQAGSNIPLLRRAMEVGSLSRPDYLEGVARYFALALREAQLRRDAELAKADVLAVYL